MSRHASMWRQLRSQLETVGRRKWRGERADADLIADAIAVALEPHEPVLDAPEPAAPRRARASLLPLALGPAALATMAAALWFFVDRVVMRSEADEAARFLALDRADVERDVAIASASVETIPAPLYAARRVSDGAAVPRADVELAAVPSAPPPRPRRIARLDAETRLRRAQQRLRNGELRMAERDYLELVEHFPRSAQADVALVTSGRLALRRGDPVAALQRYDRYLRRAAGVLREESRYGRIQALRALGRATQEAAAIAAFLADHPRSIYAGRLGTRLKALESSR